MPNLIGALNTIASAFGDGRTVAFELLAQVLSTHEIPTPRNLPRTARSSRFR
jgi:hypothetical protein